MKRKLEGPPRAIAKYRYMKSDLGRILDPTGIGDRVGVLEQRRIRRGPSYFGADLLFAIQRGAYQIVLAK